jgi:hypothetical protein
MPRIVAAATTTTTIRIPRERLPPIGSGATSKPMGRE